MLANSMGLLHDAGHKVRLVITCKAAPEYGFRENDFQRLAGDLGAEFIQTQDIHAPEVVARIRSIGAPIGISVNWVGLIRQEVCSAFQHGILNAHSGDLPKYRGNAPIAWAMLQGEKKIGFTIHRMDPDALDAGPIVVKDYYALHETTYIAEVFAYQDKKVPDLFLKAVQGLENGTITPRPQPEDPSASLRCFARRPEDGRLDWRLNAEDLARLVRVSAEPFAGAFTFHDGGKLTVWRARAEPRPYPLLAVPGQVVHRDGSTGEVAVASRDGLLVLEQVEREGAGRCRPCEVIKSLRDRLRRHAPQHATW